jgi:hypothetical protein
MTIRLSYHVVLYAIAVLPATAVSAPLFESDEALSVTIEAPMREILRHRDRDQEYDAVLSYVDAAGVEQQLNLKWSLSTRSL